MSRNLSNINKSDRVTSLPLQGTRKGYVAQDAATLTLTADQSYSMVELLRAAGGAITLPALSACPNGTEFEFYLGATLTGDVTITCAGSDTIAGVSVTAADGAAANSPTAATVITFDQSASAAQGASVCLIAGQSQWYYKSFSDAAVGITAA